MQKYYKLTMDGLLRVTTRVVWVLLVLPPAALGTVYWVSKESLAGMTNPPAADAVFPLALAGAVLLSACIAYFTRKLAPRGFAMNDIELLIDRELRPITIPLASVTELRRVDDAEMKGALRLMGASGFYAHYGLFWTRKLGKFRLYSGRFKDLVLVRTEKDVYVLGPDSPEEFVADLRPLLRR